MMTNRFLCIPSGAALLVTLSVTTLSFSTAYADDGSAAGTPKLTMLQAEKIAESTFQIGPDYTLQNESYNSTPGGSEPQTYSFNYAQSDPVQPGQWIGVTIDANTGRVINFNQPTQDNHFAFPVPKSPDEAKTIAIEWAKKLYPGEYNQVTMLPLQAKFGSLLGPVSYTYNFERMVSGIPAPFDGFSITIDQDGQIISVLDHWSDVQFPTDTSVVPKAKISDLYNNSLDLHLVYRPVWNKEATSTTELLYTQSVQPNNYWNTMFGDQSVIGAPVFNALTAEVIDSTGMAQKITPYQSPKPLVPGGPALPATLQAVNWDQTQTLNFAKQVLGITGRDQLLNANEVQAPKNVTTWNFVWKTSGSQQINASMNATYGFLTNYGKYRVGPVESTGTASQSPAVRPTQQEINQKVDDFVKRVYTRATGSVAVIPTPISNPSTQLQTSFQVVTLVNGITNEANQGNIDVDPATGEIQNVWFNIGESQGETLPSTNSAIAIEQAKQTWTLSRPLTLEYLVTQPTVDGVPNNGKTPTSTVKDPKVVLAYAPLSQNGMDALNAVTGKFDGPLTQAPYSGKMNDLDGNPAAAQIQLLVNRELVTVDANGNVHPGQELTNSAFIKLAVDALGQQYRYNPKMAMDSAATAALSNVPATSPVYQEVAVAYQLGWLPKDQPFKPDDLLTRSFAAQIIARALGYGPLLTHPDAFQTTAKDASTISKGEFAADAAISALGILPLVDGNFNSGGHVTLADAAIAIVQTANLWGNPDLKYLPQ